MAATTDADLITTDYGPSTVGTDSTDAATSYKGKTEYPGA